MMGGFAIIPDRDQQPAALFSDLEQAMDWGVRTFGADSFSIRWIEVAVLARDEARIPFSMT